MNFCSRRTTSRKCLPLHFAGPKVLQTVPFFSPENDLCSSLASKKETQHTSQIGWFPATPLNFEAGPAATRKSSAEEITRTREKFLASLEAQRQSQVKEWVLFFSDGLHEVAAQGANEDGGSAVQVGEGDDGDGARGCKGRAFLCYQVIVFVVENSLTGMRQGGCPYRPRAAQQTQCGEFRGRGGNRSGRNGGTAMLVPTVQKLVVGSGAGSSVEVFSRRGEAGADGGFAARGRERSECKG